jgi:hypothetical protein
MVLDERLILDALGSGLVGYGSLRWRKVWGGTAGSSARVPEGLR